MVGGYDDGLAPWNAESVALAPAHHLLGHVGQGSSAQSDKESAHRIGDGVVAERAVGITMMGAAFPPSPSST